MTKLKPQQQAPRCVCKCGACCAAPRWPAQAAAATTRAAHINYVAAIRAPQSNVVIDVHTVNRMLRAPIEASGVRSARLWSPLRSDHKSAAAQTRYPPRAALCAAN